MSKETNKQTPPTKDGCVVLATSTFNGTQISLPVKVIEKLKLERGVASHIAYILNKKDEVVIKKAELKIKVC